MIDRLRASMLGILIAILAIQPSSASQQMMGFFGGGSSSLNVGLISFWNLEEASGTRADAVGSNNLTDNNTVTQAAGKILNAAQFTAANSEYLSIADNAALSVGDISFTVSAWIYLDSLGADRTVLSKDNGAGVYDLRVTNTNRVLWLVRQSGGADCGRVTATNFGALSASTWYHVVAYHDADANEVGVVINSGTPQTASTTGTPFDDSVAFAVGRHSDGSFPQYWNGRIDAVGFWKKKLSTSEIATLHNAGSGKQAPL